MAPFTFSPISFVVLALFYVAISVESMAVPAIFAFGDSLADVGNNNYLNVPINDKSNFPHNGIDFPGQVPTGRFSNGFNTIDFIDNLRSDLREHGFAEKLNEKTDVETKHTTKRKDYSRRGDDSFFKLDPGLPSEKKMPPEPELGMKTLNKEHKSLDSAKNDEKKLDTRDDTFGRRDGRVVSGENLSRSWRDDRIGRREGGFNRGNEKRNGNWLPRNDFRDRFSGRGPPRGHERFSSARFSDRNQMQHVTGARTDRWKHDKYEEANQSLTNEEDEIAKVEKLLAL